MKVLCVIDSLGSGGAQRQMAQLACGLKQRGHAVELFLYHPGAGHFRADVDAAGIPVHEVPRRGGTGFSLEVLHGLRRLLSNDDFDAIISFQPTANVYAALARLHRLDCRLIVSERSAAANTTSPIRRALAYLGNLGATAVVCNSHSHAAHVSRSPGLGRKTHAIWNGYGMSALADPGVSSPGGLRQLLVVGRVSAEKNGLRLMKALAAFLQRNGRVPLVQWAGRQDSNQGSRQARQQMEEFLAAHPELARNWRWLGEVSDVGRLYRQADALVLVSLYEGLPNVVCEAMLAGCPVIASDVCDNPLLLGTNERGLLCDPLSPESICDAIERLDRMSTQDRTAMAGRACRFAEENLSLDRMVSAYEQLLVGDPAWKVA